MTQHYNRPPIIEAVTEFRFASSVDENSLSRANDALAKFYPQEQEFLQVQFEIGPGTVNGDPIKASPKDKVWRRSAADHQQVAVLNPGAFAVSQLAPYEGWGPFSDRIRRDWKTFVEKVGRRRLSRLGMRYINRIDIPINEQLGNNPIIIDQSQYVRITMKVPDGFGEEFGYAISAHFRRPDVPANVTVNTSVIPGVVVPRHMSINLDIDVGVEANIPQSDEGLLGMLEKMRDIKNFFFEESITDNARSLFQ